MDPAGERTGNGSRSDHAGAAHQLTASPYRGLALSALLLCFFWTPISRFGEGYYSPADVTQGFSLTRVENGHVPGNDLLSDLVVEMEPWRVSLFGDRLHVIVDGDAQAAARELTARLAREGIRVSEARDDDYTLEDVFLAIVEKGAVAA